MEETGAEQTAQRPICRWCRRYLRRPEDDCLCSQKCRESFARFGMSRLELQLKHCIFSASGNRFRKSCLWCYSFFETEDPTVDFCSAEHGELYASHRKRSLAQVRLDEYEPQRYERRLTRNFVRLKCLWCGEKFDGRVGSKFCCERHQRLSRRHGGTQAEFYAKFGILAEEGGKYRKRCQCCGVEFLTGNITQANCSPNCNKMFAKHGRLSDALYEQKRDSLRSARAEGVDTPFGKSVIKAVIGSGDEDWREKVKFVMSLPTDRRFAFTKDWTDREKDYAQSLVHQAPAQTKQLDDSGLEALARGVEDLDDLY